MRSEMAPHDMIVGTGPGKVDKLPVGRLQVAQGLGGLG